jgi:hypothetical protein
MFNPQYKYMNKWFIVGTIQDIQDQTRSSDGSSFGTQLVISTGFPSGIVRVRIPNNKNVPNAHDQAIMQYEIGSRVAVGFGQEWLRIEEREYNGRTYHNFTQFRLPQLATQEQHNRCAGKLIGELKSKLLDGDKYIIVLEMYETDKDGKEVLRNGQSDPRMFTLVARGEIAQKVHATSEGSNVECSVRMMNDVVRDDFGDIVETLNELRIEKFNVLSQVQSQTAPSFAQPFAQPAQAPVFNPTQQPANPLPFGQPAQSQTFMFNGNPNAQVFGGQAQAQPQVPFPGFNQ